MLDNIEEAFWLENCVLSRDIHGLISVNEGEMMYMTHNNRLSACGICSASI